MTLSWQFFKLANDCSAVSSKSRGILPTDQQVCAQGINAIFTLLGNVINYALFAAGALALIFILIGGLQYVLSSGNPQNTAKAKNTITYAIIGLVIVIMALVIVKFVRGLYS